MKHPRERDEQATYQIKVQGILDETWSEWLGDLAVTHLPDGDTLLTGPVRDQAALHGLLNKIRDLGIPLLSLTKQNEQV